jgi:ABC-2 type transport system permease protein
MTMFDLDRVWLVAKREWFTRIKQRSFRVTTAVQILIVVLAACIPTLVGIIAGDDEPDTVSISVLDESGAGMTERLVPYLEADIPDQAVLNVEPFTGTTDALRQAVDNDDTDVGLAISRDADGALAFTYISTSGDGDVLAQRVYGAVQTLNLEDRFSQVGVTGQQFQEAYGAPNFQLSSASNSSDDVSDAESGAKYAIAYVLAFISYMAVILYGSWVAQGVVEEKSSRIMEIMINAATPRDLLFGKVLGIGMAAMAQLVPTILLGGLFLSMQGRIADRFDVDGVSVLEIDFGALSLQAGGWFLIYFLLGFILYAALYAGVGSLVSRQEEVNQAVAPMTTVMIGSFIGAIFTLSAPDSMVARVLSIIPFTSPTTMVPRIILGEPAAWEIGLSLALLLASAVVALIIAGRIYRVGVLMYGQKPSLKSVFTTGAAEVSR